MLRIKNMSKLFDRLSDYKLIFNKIEPYIGQSYPYLFLIQCIYFVTLNRTTRKQEKSIFSDFFVTMFGSTVPFILFFHDTPAWIMNSKYYFTFFVGWLISVTLLQLFPRFLTCTPINAILSLGMNFSMSHVVLNAIERTLKNFSSNQLLISFLVAFVAGCGSHFVFFRKRSVDQMEHQRITFVWLLTFNMYFLLLKPEFYYKAFLSIPNIDNYSLENLTEKGENFDDLLNSKSYKDIPRAFKLVFGYFIDYAKSYVDEKPKESKYFPASLIRDIIPILVMAGVSSYSFIVYLISSIGKMCKKCQSPSPKKKVKTN